MIKWRALLIGLPTAFIGFLWAYLYFHAGANWSEDFSVFSFFGSAFMAAVGTVISVVSLVERFFNWVAQ